MVKLHRSHPLRIFWVSALLTIATGVLVSLSLGISGLWLFCILVVLEVTFSFDNAIINSKILSRMSRFWQQLFLTVGILFAVFIVRFILPVFIVGVSAHIGFTDVITMALHQPDKYSEILHGAAPIINAFGGTFLVMIGVSYFLDRQKEIHWLGNIEQWLSRFGTYENFKTLIMLIVAMGLYASVDEKYKEVVLVASIVGTALHLALGLFSDYFGDRQSNSKHLVGLAAFASFIYLNVLDASFSLDGVIGAFAITTNVVLIMAGLGAGALWVRSLTVYLVRAKTLSKYRYLENGAHWAILILGIIMLVKLYHIDPPEWFTGTIGLILISAAILSSVIAQRHRDS